MTTTISSKCSTRSNTSLRESTITSACTLLLATCHRLSLKQRFRYETNLNCLRHLRGALQPFLTCSFQVWGSKSQMIFKRLLLLLVAFVACTFQLAAQTPNDDVDVVRVNTDVTNLPFTVVDKQHRFITTLNVDDIRVLEDGVPQQLFTFQREADRPLAIAFLIDVSISQQYTLSDEKAAARGFIESAIHSNKDQVAVVPFTGQAFLEQGLTRDVLSVYRVLQQIDVAIPAYQGVR